MPSWGCQSLLWSVKFFRLGFSSNEGNFLDLWIDWWGTSAGDFPNLLKLLQIVFFRELYLLGSYKWQAFYLLFKLHVMRWFLTRFYELLMEEPKQNFKNGFFEKVVGLKIQEGILSEVIFYCLLNFSQPFVYSCMVIACGYSLLDLFEIAKNADCLHDAWSMTF